MCRLPVPPVRLAKNMPVAWYITRLLKRMILSTIMSMARRKVGMEINWPFALNLHGISPNVRQAMGAYQTLRQFQSVYGPEALWARAAYMRLSGRRAAFEQGFDPSAGDSVPAVHSTQKRATYGSVGVGVSATHDGVHHGLFQIWSMQELPQRIAECRQDPSLLVDIIDGRCLGSSPDRIQEVPIHLHSFRPGHDLAI